MEVNTTDLLSLFLDSDIVGAIVTCSITALFLLIILIPLEDGGQKLKDQY